MDVGLDETIEQARTPRRAPGTRRADRGRARGTPVRRGEAAQPARDRADRGRGRATVDARLGDLEVSLRERGIRLLSAGDRIELATAPETGALVARYVGADAVRLSPAGLETLAIVAYRQPVTRAAVERIRGVDSDHTLRSLLAPPARRGAGSLGGARAARSCTAPRSSSSSGSGSRASTTCRRWMPTWRHAWPRRAARCCSRSMMPRPRPTPGQDDDDSGRLSAPCPKSASRRSLPPPASPRAARPRSSSPRAAFASTASRATIGQKVDPAVATIEVDGTPVGIGAARAYVALHKPAGVTSTTRDRHAETTVLDLVSDRPRAGWDAAVPRRAPRPGLGGAPAPHERRRLGGARSFIRGSASSASTPWRSAPADTPTRFAYSMAGSGSTRASASLARPLRSATGTETRQLAGTLDPPAGSRARLVPRDPRPGLEAPAPTDVRRRRGTDRPARSCPDRAGLAR